MILFHHFQVKKSKYNVAKVYHRNFQRCNEKNENYFRKKLVKE